MKKPELKNHLSNGGSFTVDALFFTFPELVVCAKAAKEGGGVLTIKNADVLRTSEINALCGHAPAHVNFNDVTFEG